MGAGYHRAHTVGDRAHHHSWLCRDGEAMYLVARVVYFLEEGVRDGDELVGTAVDTDAVDLIVHTYHLIVSAIHPDAFPARVATAGEELLVNLLADDTHLAP